MNIFIMIFAVLIMGAYFMMGSPAQRMIHQEAEYAIGRSDLRGFAECAAAAHNAAIRGGVFDDVCVEQNGIVSTNICLNNNLSETKCEVVRNRKPAYSYIITTTAPINDDEFDSMMQVLEENFSDAGTFGILSDGKIVAGGTATRRVVPKSIIKAQELVDGQLVYMTQYEIPDTETEFSTPYAMDVRCPAGTVRTYRFNKWQCVGYNTKSACGGDMIWDSDALACVPDESRKPLCASEQTAVMVDDVWECINPFPDRHCPDGMLARLDYTTLEWECVSDPDATRKTTKCDAYTSDAVYGAIGATLRVSASSCTDCEKLVVDDATCSAKCVPDTSKITDGRCYPGAAGACNGASRAFYFGFPSTSYAENVDAVRNREIPIDRSHSQNRKFNCLDCGDREIDMERSYPPYTAFCK